MTRKQSLAQRPLPKGISLDTRRSKPFLARISRGGKRFSRSFGSLDEALSWRNQVLRELKAEARRRGSGCRDNSHRPSAERTFSTAARLFVAEHARLHNLKESTASKQRQIVETSLIPYFGNAGVDEIDTDVVLEFCLSSLERRVGKHTLSRKTLLNHLAVLSSFFRWAEVRKLSFHNPVPNARSQFRYSCTPERKLREQVLTEDEFRRLLAVARCRRPEAYAPIALAAFSGLRRGELAGLLWGDVITHNHLGEPLPLPRLSVTKQVLAVEGRLHKEDSTKSSRDRLVPLNATAWVIVEQWRREAHETHGFSTDTAAPIFPLVASNPENFSKNIYWRLCEKADIPGEKRRFHALRHTFAGWLRLRDVSPRQLQLLLGHSTPHMSELYGRVFGVTCEAVTDRLDDILDIPISATAVDSSYSTDSVTGNVVRFRARRGSESAGRWR